MEIKKLLAHSSNFTKGRPGGIKFIAIHYTANNGDTAKGNCNYFSAANRNASAHYFVDETSVYQSVEDGDTGWSVGAKNYAHSTCRNPNSISIEMCSKRDAKGAYYIEPVVVAKTIELTKILMAKYNVPVSNVLRHYDITGKNCPEPFVRDLGKWNAFKNSLTAKVVVKEVDKVEEEDDEMAVVRYNTIKEIPAYAQATVQSLITKGAFADVNKLNLTDDMLRTFVIMERANK